mmetsp:Transcript_7069/g.18122  ORF Transcript_7069/g.18122 Transcript_7069/m.18122 type:complete len:305 (-) Transcript_7069:98-1012(-)|eukprot:CAMPEP_0182928296 /NCGR_PEP_ID=MMETSP0105_2-20130417/15514_1 /TAXON_ID=81532 ORGANISM="Acanthoeca-like sp., Strain 10tr" /NCGR_SAMPLE_ID=MMETSP0105_2 /ASSEMBLY_ACC=CAM_ASM_000205 /LENGTH=304 /DNA_ID=CAMNT_0025066297 /DNA_START=359 /DNA_END=1273 /DNA_ORIENTATION=-
MAAATYGMAFGAADDDEEWESSDTDEGELDDEELQARFAAGDLRGQGDGAIREALPRKKGSLDEAAILTKHKEIAVTPSLKWVETFAVSSDFPDVAANDDFARENAFYDHTVAAVQSGFALLKKHGVPIQRPSDYYAEMLKTDEHMARVKERLIVENKKIVASEQARKQRENKKFGKKIQQEVLAKRQQAKREAIAGANKLRTGLKQKVANAAADFAVEALPDDGDRGPKRGASKKRAARDAKFGYGGKSNNSRSKRNDSASYMEGRFSVAKNKALPRGITAGKGSKGKANKRPGKSKRKGAKK